eukprot:TRINITY_DN12717_c0_g1_i1.p1 TRINITY_DN12717_c0_g1~~TRINITY_DN12717_c0_g1_i1.p1  ORF type:complete len:316 (+),score=61.75 TRINITY_DN12717_c0_g1_i1:84-1031(+)
MFIELRFKCTLNSQLRSLVFIGLENKQISRYFPDNSQDHEDSDDGDDDGDDDENDIGAFQGDKTPKFSKRRRRSSHLRPYPVRSRGNSLLSTASDDGKVSPDKQVHLSFTEINHRKKRYQARIKDLKFYEANYITSLDSFIVHMDGPLRESPQRGVEISPIKRPQPSRRLSASSTRSNRADSISRLSSDSAGKNALHKDSNVFQSEPVQVLRDVQMTLSANDLLECLDEQSDEDEQSQRALLVITLKPDSLKSESGAGGGGINSKSCVITEKETSQSAIERRVIRGSFSGKSNGSQILEQDGYNLLSEKKEGNQH